jgi:hypothetical protein
MYNKKLYESIMEAIAKEVNFLLERKDSTMIPVAKQHALTESLHNDYVAVYTGLLYSSDMASIINSVAGQVTDGIGEGDSRESKIFAYYYQMLSTISAGCINDELVIKTTDWFDIENLVRCIWRIAQIERSDRRTSNKDIKYEYLDGATWKQICTLQGALQNVIKKQKNAPWTEEERQKALARRDASIAKAEAAAKAEEERLAAEAAAKEAADTEHINNVISHSVEDKDVKRATDAWNRTHSLSKFFDVLLQQLNKIEDTAKAHRRTVAFYNEALNHVNEPDYDRVMERFKSLMLNRF